MCDGCGADCLAPLRSKKMMKEIEKLRRKNKKTKHKE